MFVLLEIRFYGIVEPVKVIVLRCALGEKKKKKIFFVHLSINVDLINVKKDQTDFYGENHFFGTSSIKSDVRSLCNH